MGAIRNCIFPFAIQATACNQDFVSFSVSPIFFHEALNQSLILDFNRKTTNNNIKVYFLTII